MPKMKTHKGAAKRIRRTGSGKLVHRGAWRVHNRHKRSARRWRRADGYKVLSGGAAKQARRLLP